MEQETMISGKTCRILTAGIALGFLGSALLVHLPRPNKVWAQSQEFRHPESSIQAFPITLNRDSEGIVMIDVNEKTVWVYEISARRPGMEQMRLIAARSWEYDRKLSEWNCAQPVPAQIQQLLEKTPTPPTEPQSPTETKQEELIKSIQ